MTRAHCAVTPFDPTTGQVLTSATVNIYSPGTVTPIAATIFDKNGNTLSNPLTSDSTTGLVDFYLGVAQEVDLVVSKASFTTRTYSNVPVLDDASNNLTALLTTTGDIAYASSANTPARLPIAGTANALLQAVGGIPAWSTLAANLGAGTSWTPSLTQGGSSPTSTNLLSTYIQIGKLVVVQFNLAITGAGSAGNALICSLPITPRRQAAYNTIGTFIYVTSGGTIYTGSAVAVSNGTFQLVTNSQTGYWGVAPSVATANNDNFAGNLTYEAN